MHASPTLAFLDFEASSLDAAGWPIEIGVSRVLADGAIDTQDHLILPHASWSMDHWSEISATVHKIPHGFLLSKGKPVADIAAWFARTYGTRHLLVSDNPEFEQRWLGRVFTACGHAPIPPVFNMHHVFAASLSESGKDHAYETLARHGHRKPHRAGPDSRLMAQAWKNGLLHTPT